MTNTINLCTYNVLAPCWADPTIYPASSLAYLDRYVRRAIIINVLKNLAQTNDIIALQETQDDEFPALQTAMAKIGFVGFSTNHHDDYWGSYATVDPPFVSNGVALFWNQKKLNLLEINGYNFSDDGNRGVIAYFRQNNKLFRVTCAHLDTDTGGRRAKEAKGIVDLLVPNDNLIDIILGDFNFDTDQGVYNNIFNNFIDVLAAVGNENQTHPFTTSYAKNANYGVIDHIMVRNATPVAGNILDFNVWTDGANEEERINLTLQRNGSDHFIVTGSVSY